MAHHVTENGLNPNFQGEPLLLLKGLNYICGFR